VNLNGYEIKRFPLNTAFKTKKIQISKCGFPDLLVLATVLN